MNKLTWMTATAALALLGTASAWADGKPTAEITGFAAYRMGGQFDVNDSTTGDENSVDLQDSGSWGIDIGIYRDATSFYELLYSQQSSDLDSGDPTIKRADVTVEYFQFGGTILYPYDENWFVPYLSLTIGAARLDVQGAGSKSDTRFSGSLGGGVRIPISENFSMTAGLRGYLTAVDSDSQFLCVGTGGSANCLIRSSGSAFFQGEALIGFTGVF
jgi:opacity protein-like surface antigen